MGVQKAVGCLGLFLAVVSLAGCQQAEHEFSSEESAVELASVSPGPIPVVPAPASPVLVPDTPPPASIPVLQGVSTSCTSFLNKEPNIDLTSKDDRFIDHLMGEKTILDPLGTISVRSVIGSLNIHSAVRATNIMAVGGEVRINAETIDEASSSTGVLCLRANHLSRVRADGNPVHTLIANTIDNLSIGGTGKVHIFNATVVQISGSVPPVPNLICLHDGAKILSLNGNNPIIIDPSCK